MVSKFLLGPSRMKFDLCFVRPAVFESFLKLLLLPRALPQSGADGEEEVTVLDLEETGYQASFSKLGASEPPRRDPVADIADPGVFMARSLVECSQAHPGQVSREIWL
jgi:exportin-2 (importin alpha re-exporter)